MSAFMSPVPLFLMLQLTSISGYLQTHLSKFNGKKGNKLLVSYILERIAKCQIGLGVISDLLSGKGWIFSINV